MKKGRKESMKLQRKHRQLIALAIGAVIIIFGVLQALLKFQIDRKYVDEGTFVLFIAALALLYGGRPKKVEDKKDDDKKDEDKKDEDKKDTKGE